ncbi:MAG: hypothetical protein QF391_08760, partial [Myxococcota bacterium]|nr:hypothetical protein [Myxococcota bacterium]
MTRSGSALAAALAVIGLSCTPLPPVDDGFETQWSAAGAQCDTYSVYCNVTLRTAWKERAAPFASACKRELDRPDPSGYRIIVTLGAAGEILPRTGASSPRPLYLTECLLIGPKENAA